MSAAPAPLTRCDLAQGYAARIEAHLARLAAGHDPLGHLFAIERLARSARSEWCEQERGPASRKGRSWAA